MNDNKANKLIEAYLYDKELKKLGFKEFEIIRDPLIPILSKGDIKEWIKVNKKWSNAIYNKIFKS